MMFTKTLVAACVCLSACQGPTGVAGGGQPNAALKGEALVAPRAKDKFAAGVGEADRLRLAQAPLAEMSFIPEDVEAVVRVDLAALVGRAQRSDKGKESLKTLDFVLHAQQPAVWEVLHNAHVSLGTDITGLYLVVGPSAKMHDSYLVAAVGRFDAGALAEALRRKAAPAFAAGKVVVEPAPAPSGETATLFIWHDAGAAGATEQPLDAKLGDAAVAVCDGVVLIGTPELTRRALATRAARDRDVRSGALIHEVLAVDTSATAWGATLPGADAFTPTVVPGVQRGRFAASLALPGAIPPDADGLVQLTAEFSTAGDAEVFRAKLLQLLGAAATLSERSPLGAAFKRLHDTASVSIDGTRLSVTAAL